MNIQTWILVGLVVGVISTAWQTRLSVKSLILAMVVGMIGSLGGGVIGYVLYGQLLGWMDLTVFSVAIALAILSIICRRWLSKLSINWRLIRNRLPRTADKPTQLITGDYLENQEKSMISSGLSLNH